MVYDKGSISRQATGIGTKTRGLSSDKPPVVGPFLSTCQGTAPVMKPVSVSCLEPGS